MSRQAKTAKKTGKKAPARKKAAADAVAANQASEQAVVSDAPVADSPKPAFTLTPTAQDILVYIADHDGEPVTKATIAAGVGRCEKTVDRLMSKLRENGYIVAEERWNPNGAQLANSYRLVR